MQDHFVSQIQAGPLKRALEDHVIVDAMVKINAIHQEAVGQEQEEMEARVTVTKGDVRPLLREEVPALSHTVYVI